MTQRKPKITAETFGAFIRSHHLCVLYVQSGLGISFNRHLRRQLKNKHRNNIVTGTIDLSKLNTFNPEIQKFIKQSIPSLGLPITSSIYPGYYLFRSGNLIAYHPGSIDPKSLDPQVDGVLTLVSALVAIINGIVERSAAKGLRTFVESMMLSLGMKVYHFFQEMLGIKDANYTQVRHQLIYHDELTRAYDLLKVTPNSTDEEIKRAWRKLMFEHHPDRNPSHREAKNKLCVEINRAYKLIMASRSQKQKQTSTTFQ